MYQGGATDLKVGGTDLASLGTEHCLEEKKKKKNSLGFNHKDNLLRKRRKGCGLQQ